MPPARHSSTAATPAYCDAVVELARGADVFLCEASWTHSPDRPPKLHLSGTEAGRVAADSRVSGELLLTHIPPWTSREDVISEAKAEFDGPVHAVVCGETFEITTLLSGLQPAVRLRRLRVGGVSRREDGRLDDELRPGRHHPRIHLPPGRFGAGRVRRTKVMCTASVTEGVPRWRKGSGLGWLTAEYAMLPSATHTRSDRESVKGRVGGRTQEISRLIGRSLRACIDLAALGENTIAVDCDVLQADGGTRTAAITGAYVALADAVTYLSAAGKLSDPRPLSCAIAAVSVGVVDGRVRVDLPYEEDSRAEVDMNVVATDTGTLVEVQGTGEGATFPRSTLDKMLDAALGACDSCSPRSARRWSCRIRVCCPRGPRRRRRSEADRRRRCRAQR